MNETHNLSVPDSQLHAIELGIRRWRVERDAAGTCAWLSSLDLLTGEATIEEAPDSHGGSVTYAAWLERIATPRLLVRQDGLPTLEAALAWLEGDRFLMREHDGVTWIADADDDARWYASLGDDRFVIERFLEPNGDAAYQVVRFPRGTRASAAVRSLGVASIVTLEQAAAVAADFEACWNVPLSRPRRVVSGRPAHA
ncbi:hypothetical protein [Burkholderia gladioli]|uniref:hypothetical protein n=1 Tax=Burkholderia gladioli TaxID=28095 RepID=UPI001641C43E|nr:hypothetical protein [Burkholderia gladioli]MBJ9677925.1 hypothetical protein [Burkholderia gladioli]